MPGLTMMFKVVERHAFRRVDVDDVVTSPIFKCNSMGAGYHGCKFDQHVYSGIRHYCRYSRFIQAPFALCSSGNK
jgi:hypothetical protein